MKWLIIFVTLLTSCAKQDRDTDGALPPMQLTAPTIKLTSPRDFQRFSAGQTVSINATIADNEQLEKVRLIVTNRATRVQVLRFEKYLDVKDYALSAVFTPEAGPRYTIRIEAVDRKNNNAETRIEVSCN